MRTATLFFIFSIISTPCHADWKLFDIYTKKTMFIDPSTIKKNGSNIKIWVKHVSMRSNETIKSGIIQMEYNCRDETERILYGRLYDDFDGKGNVIFTFEEYKQATPILPGEGFDRSLLNVLCNE